MVNNGTQRPHLPRCRGWADGSKPTQPLSSIRYAKFSSDATAPSGPLLSGLEFSYQTIGGPVNMSPHPLRERHQRVLLEWP